MEITYQLPSFVSEILEKVSDAGYEIYIVGGAVRDILMQQQQKKVPSKDGVLILMGKKPLDWDFATDAKPEEVLKIFPDAFYDNVFGTVRIPHPSTSSGQDFYEITTFRREWKYSDRRHPQILEWGKSIEEDLARRDFTINAMSLKQNEGGMPHRELSPRSPKATVSEVDASTEDACVGERAGRRPTEALNILELIDPFNGQEDLKNKLIRAVGNPEERFSEDALRLVRAVRFATQLEFLIEPGTFAAIQKNASLIKDISGERIGDELLKILNSPYSADGFRLLRNSDLLAYILPELDKAFGVAQARHHKFDVGEHSLRSLAHCPSRDPQVRFATLLHDIGKVVVKAYQCKKCGKIFRTHEAPKVVCPSCQTQNNQQESAIFYNHEVASASLVRNIADRLHFPKKDRDRVVNLVRHHQFTVDEQITDSAIRRFIGRVGEKNINDILDLRIGDRLGGGCIEAESWRLRRFKKRIWEIQHPPPSIADLAVNGNDVMAELNITPGPKVGQILKTLFEEVVDEPKKNNKGYLLKRIQEIGEKI